MTPTPIAADLPEPVWQYRLKGEEAWHDEGSGPTPDAWHLDCVQPDHEWRSIYTADQVREAIAAKDAEIARLRGALSELVYRDGKAWRICIIGDADVSDVVGDLLDGKAIEAGRKAREVPEGYVLVPREPTEAMCRSGLGVGGSTYTTSPRLCYLAMIAAAPHKEPKP